VRTQYRSCQPNFTNHVNLGTQVGEFRHFKSETAKDTWRRSKPELVDTCMTDAISLGSTWQIGVDLGSILRVVELMTVKMTRERQPNLSDEVWVVHFLANLEHLSPYS
jgi:hypothetical protein